MNKLIDSLKAKEVSQLDLLVYTLVIVAAIMINGQRQIHASREAARERMEAAERRQERDHVFQRELFKQKADWEDKL